MLTKIGTRKKERIKDNSKVCGLVNQKDVDGEDWDEASVGVKTYLV